jgi:hypothetical protein
MHLINRQLGKLWSTGKMTERDISGNVAALTTALASYMPPPGTEDYKEQDAVVLTTAGTLLSQFLVDQHRIAEALEALARVATHPVP